MQTLVSESHHTVILKALKHLAGNDQDHAAEQNGIGFNGGDSRFGHDLANRDFLTPSQYRAAFEMLKKYRKQLQSAGIELPPDPPPPPPTFRPVQQQGTVIESNIPGTRIVAETQKTRGKHISIREIDGERRVIVTFGGYYPDLVEKIKTIPGRHYDPQTRDWDLPLNVLGLVRAKFPDFSLSDEIDGAEKRAKAEAAAEAKRIEGEKLLSAVDLDKEYPFGHLFEHQKKAIRAMLTGDMTLASVKEINPAQLSLYRGNSGFVILADDMGLGKTKEALVAAQAYQRVYGDYIFVIAPVSLRENWLREAASVGARIEFYSWAKIPDVLESVKGRYVLICDEAHYAQNLKSTRTQRALDMAEHARAVFMLTGTPIKNGRPANLFPLLKAVRHRLSKDKRHYEKQYCAAGPTRFSKWDTTGAAHLDELHTYTRDAMIRRMKRECLDLPPKTRIFRRAELSADAKRKYDQAFAELRGRYLDGVKAKLAEAQSLRAKRNELLALQDEEIDEPRGKEIAEIEKQIQRLESAESADAIVLLNNLRHAGSIGKVDSVIEWAEEILEQGQQVVIFTEFETSAREIHRRLGGELLLGDTPTNKRQELVDRFQNGYSKVFVGTIKAGGVGITLTAAQDVILVDRPWTPGDAKQAEDRLDRIGQKGNVTAIWAQYGDVDIKIDKILEKKEERIELVLAGKRKTMRGIASAQDVAQQALLEMFESPENDDEEENDDWDEEE